MSGYNYKPAREQVDEAALTAMRLIGKHVPSNEDNDSMVGIALSLFTLLRSYIALAIITGDCELAGTVLINGLHAAYALGYERGSNQDPAIKAGTELLKLLKNTGGERA